MGEFFLTETREGVSSLGYRDDEKEFRLHSAYRPIKETEKWINFRKEKIQSASHILVYGLGLGYHIKELEKYRKRDAKVYVLEMNPDVIAYTEKEMSIEEYKNLGYVFCISNNLEEVKNFLISTLSYFNTAESVLLIHQPSLRTIPESCTPIKHLLEEWEVMRDTFNRNKELLRENFLKNVEKIDSYRSLNIFQNKFKEVPIIIVSAGPSLDKNKHLLRKAKNKALIMAVGSAVKPLLQIGIEPDCIVISDPKPGVCRQLEGLDITAPLFMFLTIQAKIIEEYKGPKVMLLQRGFELAEKLAEDQGHILIETGGSVATTALELAVYFGGSPIIFVGQDLAYTSGKTHTDGTVHDKWIPKLNIR